jgi:hypothetical protein
VTFRRRVMKALTISTRRGWPSTQWSAAQHGRLCGNRCWRCYPRCSRGGSKSTGAMSRRPGLSFKLRRPTSASHVTVLPK